MSLNTENNKLWLVLDRHGCIQQSVQENSSMFARTLKRVRGTDLIMVLLDDYDHPDQMHTSVRAVVGAHSYNSSSVCYQCQYAWNYYVRQIQSGADRI